MNRRAAGPVSSLEPVHHDERVVVPGDLEGPRAAAEHLDLARPAGRRPDRGGGLADVAQHGTEDEDRRCGVHGGHGKR
jgi:hypothetical protein